MKKIVFDIIHLAHINFFKNAINFLHNKGYKIEIIYLDRGKIEKVLKKELPNYKITKIGSYSKTTFGKIFMILDRAIKLNRYLKNSKPDSTAGVGDFILAFSSRIKKIPSIIFYDDFEFKLNFNLSHFFGNKLIIPDSIPAKGKKIIKYHGFKELAYLHPKIYKPKKSIIVKMGLKENNYVFAREVAGISMNYSNLKKDSLLKYIKYIKNKGIKIILSLEDKSRKEIYAPYCTILEEPLEDLYSIMSYARFSISSGDSMARESALLGVQCIYTGGRYMAVNKPLIFWKGIYKIENEKKIIAEIDKLFDKKVKHTWSLRIKKKINEGLADTTQIITNQIITSLLKKE